MPDAVITKIKSPREEFEKERAELISHYTKSLKRELERIQSSKYEEEAKQELMMVNTDGLTDMYYKMPYVEKYIEWNVNALSDVITTEDVRIISNTMMFTPRNEAITLFLNYLCTAEQRYNTYKGFRSDPSKAEQPLTEEITDLFLLFLDKAFKPAFLLLLEDMRQSKYRTLDKISQEINAAFDVWFQDQTEVNKKIHSDLVKEQFYPTNDLIEYTKEYAKKIGFKDILSKHGFLGELAIAENEPIEKAQAIYANTFLLNPTKLSRNLHEIENNNDEHFYIVSPTKGKAAKRKSIVSVMLTDTDSNSVKLTRPITITDRAIIEAVETLAQYNEYITAAEVYRMLNGGENIRMRPELIEEIEGRIDYMRRIMARIDYTQHMNMNGREGTYTKEDTLLNLIKEKVSLNGKTVTAYKYKAISPLFKYALDVRQIVSIPAPMLSTKGGQKGGTRSLAIKYYLLQRLFTIKGQGTVISLPKLLEEIGEPNPSTPQLKKIRSIIESFLEIWSYGKVRESSTKPDKEILDKTPIKGYSINTVGKKITGYTLIPKTVDLSIPDKRK